MKTQTVFSVRLKAARVMAGLSMQELADKVGITKQAIGKYEKGTMQPTSSVLISIARTLQIKVDYFFRPKTVQLANIEFRKRTRLSKKEQERILEQATDLLERYLELEALLGIENPFQHPLHNTVVQTPSEAQHAANQLRETWQLGFGPIANIIEMLEEKGVRIIEVEAPDFFDGLFAWAGNIPLIVLNTTMPDITRKRFTTIHEMAHLLLSFHDTTEHKTKENLCHIFAGAFLLPQKPFLAKIGVRRSQLLRQELIEIKEYFGISIRAIVKRAHTLGVISDSLYKNACITMNKEWGAKKEPGNYQGKEKSTRFQQLLYRALAEDIISIGKAASLANTTVAELEKTSEVVL